VRRPPVIADDEAGRRFLRRTRAAGSGAEAFSDITEHRRSAVGRLASSVAAMVGGRRGHQLVRKENRPAVRYHEQVAWAE
jgi:hypothetical protein